MTSLLATLRPLVQQRSLASILKSLFLSLILFVALSADGAISRVQLAKGGTANVNSANFTISLTPTVGNIVVLCIGAKTTVALTITQTNVNWVCDQGTYNNTEV